MMLKMLILTLIFCLGPAEVGASRPGLQSEMSEREDAPAAFAVPSAVVTTFAKVQEIRETAARESQEREIIFSAPSSEAVKPLICAIQEAYKIVKSSQQQDDFRANTARIQRGLVALAAALQGIPTPFTQKSGGFTEEEWTKEEQRFMNDIQEILILGNGNYGANKQFIQACERLIISSQRNRDCLRYISFVFNDDPASKDGSLTPMLAHHEGSLGLLKSRLEAEEVAEVAKADEVGIDPSLFSALKEEFIWGKMISIFILGMDRAQANGWPNWTRTCLVVAFVDALESYKLAGSRRQTLEPPKINLW